jgi:hypothetical protein
MYIILMYLALVMAPCYIEAALVLVAVICIRTCKATGKRRDATTISPTLHGNRIIASGRLHEWQVVMRVLPCINGLAC